MSTLDFLESNIGEVGAFSDGGFAPFIGADVVLKDVMLKKTAGNQWELNLPSVAQFFTISGPGITYTLESFSLTRLASGNFEASFSGFFFDPRDNEQAEGLGDFTSQRRFGSTGTSLSLDVEAIPTPALLPGLVGFGIAALRKRKGEAVTATESEA
ncbi:MAG: PTPA-CTERM sorting domain-containing protein [Leptolyngbyaceae cyanobacterium bins.302]|nr:PTPA-CTERM sorting domain-containing protein [Leptolyngbyaceae cyanobacterium bins.302]